ncbi:ATP-binding protein [uncultured Tenacibaculum sp.]|uniref:AlbA family DNA-binding domain-containing protein n=1 Tax=uncultured Tenacibaculum sp. TaxID=174713 RepID=UPI0026168439|nr:ATP-binding protein [uncultured Tenacibaculum sp.]
MTRKDIENIIENKVRESNTLEFKQAEALYNLARKQEEDINEFTKDITAIANSSGGIIIYGIQEFPKGNNKGKAKKLSPIDKSKISVEWMEQIMNSRIQPRIQNYKIYEIDINENQFVVAIDFQESTTVHQANDKRYYKRFEFQSVKMDDWEIKSLVNRYNKPIIQEKIFIQKKPDYLIKQLTKLRAYDYELVIAVENTGNIMVNYLNCFLQIEKSAFKHIDFTNLEKNSLSDFFEIPFSNKITRTITIQNNKFEIGSEYEPIMPNSWRRLKIIPINKSFFEEKIEFEFFTSTESTHSNQKYLTSELEVVEK